MRARLDVTVPVLLLKGVRDPLQQAGLAVSRSLGSLGIAVHGVYDDVETPAARSRWVRTRSAWSLDRETPAATLAHLAERAAAIGGRPILLPTDDVAAMFVDEHAEALRTTFAFPLQPTGLARRLADKRELQRLCSAEGVDTPRCVYPETRAELLAALDEMQFPVVLKSMDPRLLRQRPGAKSVTIATSAAELLQAYDAMEVPGAPNLMLQEYVPGDARTVWMFNGYFDADSECRFGMTGQKIRQSPPATGATSLGICVHNAEVFDATVRLMKAIGYRGILDLGWRFDRRDGRYKLLDVNPRIGATFRLFVGRHGMDVARALYLDQTGQSVPADQPAPGRRWAVELRDLGSARQARAAGELSLWGWVRSYAGVRETAWFDAGDRTPFVAMLQTYARRRRRWPRFGSRGLFWRAAMVAAALGGIAGGAPRVQAQDDRYLMGAERQLEMIVYIMGEVKAPGEYRVRDNTTALELLSKAGGPTEYADMGEITIRHTTPLANAGSAVVEIDLGKYLREADAPPPPVLRPGDVIRVPGNNWRVWRTSFAIVRDLAVIASAYFLYLEIDD